VRRAVSEHRQQVLELVRGAWQRRLAAEAQESVPLAGALHRVLARDLAAPVSLPPFANSQMDGYAVSSTTTAAAGSASGTTAGSTVEFDVAPPVPAGSPAGTGCHRAAPSR
jgi:molybdopterin molybdotransferase